MISEHRIYFADSKNMSPIDSSSVHLVVTSPPYPMIKMWDDGFSRRPSIKQALRNGNGRLAFELMHRELARVWQELHRVMVPGGIACINIGDATRTLKGEFALYPNHSRVLADMLTLGFTNLPNILWRKQTNAPNKFMGSGMLPPGAYVTLEHETILVFRKGGKRLFNTQAEKDIRRQSAFFWEERNVWFSDVWMDLKGTRQDTADKKVRQRSAAYPFELAYRLLCMFSVMGDRILDPFVGTGTTMLAAACTGRNSVGYELDEAFRPLISKGWEQVVGHGRQRISKRFDDHLRFIRDRKAANKIIKHTNQIYGFPVVTRQETQLMIPLPNDVQETILDQYRVSYTLPELSNSGQIASISQISQPGPNGQLKMFN